MEKLYTRTVEIGLIKEITVYLNPDDFEDENSFNEALDEDIINMVDFDISSLKSEGYQLMELEIKNNN